MALPYSQPVGEAFLVTSLSIGASTSTATMVVPAKGRIQRTGCTLVSGTCSGATATITVKVFPVGGTLSTDIGALTMPVGTGPGGATASTEDWPSFNGASVYVNDGDRIEWACAGGTGGT